MTSDSVASSPRPKPSSERYDLLTQAVHWLSFLLIVAAFVTGLILEGTPRNARAQIGPLHISIGMLTLILIVIRVPWLLIVKTPGPLVGPRWMQIAMKAMDGALYLLMLAIPITGMLISWSNGRAISIFGLLKLSPPFEKSPALAQMMQEPHEWMSWALIILVCGHAGAALFHQYILRDGAMARMLPFGWVRRG